VAVAGAEVGIARSMATTRDVACPEAHHCTRWTPVPCVARAISSTVDTVAAGAVDARQRTLMLAKTTVVATQAAVACTTCTSCPVTVATAIAGAEACAVAASVVNTGGEGCGAVGLTEVATAAELTRARAVSGHRVVADTNSTAHSIGHDTTTANIAVGTKEVRRARVARKICVDLEAKGASTQPSALTALVATTVARAHSSGGFVEPEAHSCAGVAEVPEVAQRAVTACPVSKELILWADATNSIQAVRANGLTIALAAAATAGVGALGTKEAIGATLAQRSVPVPVHCVVEADTPVIRITRPVTVACIVNATIDFDGWLKRQRDVGVGVKDEPQERWAVQDNDSIGAVAAVLQTHNERAVHVEVIFTRHEMGSEVKADVHSHAKFPSVDEQWLDAVLRTITSGGIHIVAPLHVRDGVARRSWWNEGLIRCEVVGCCFVEPDAHERCRRGV
jgi:hypothetical protein